MEFIQINIISHNTERFEFTSRSLDEIKKILADKKIVPENDIIVSCSTGREATLQYVVLKHLLNYPKVRIYEGSWTEYSTQKDLPVATVEEKLT
jgi:thiosulfate/3-mercaptopyruvate sulfurtransferase